jgi:hypothetical protein
MGIQFSILVVLLSLVYGCSHPIQIVGEGDVHSATGTRDCYLEEYLTGAENCSKNLVVHDYIETYYGVAREGWEFSHWENYCTDGSTGGQCSFNIDASVVRKFWGQTAAPLVAVFEKKIPPLEPVALYSYAIDDAGLLVDPLPLEGAELERRITFFTFSFTDDYERINFWCCKVPEGEEAHGEKVEDSAAPFVLRVDLGALPDDAGLARELYADLFTSATDYTGHTASWTLESPSLLVRYNFDANFASGAVDDPGNLLSLEEGTRLEGSFTVKIAGEYKNAIRDFTLSFGGETYTPEYINSSHISYPGFDPWLSWGNFELHITFDPVGPLDEITFGIIIETEIQENWALGDEVPSTHDTYVWFYGAQGDTRFTYPNLGGGGVTVTLD